MQVEPFDPKVVGYFHGTMQAMTYRFAEFQRNLARTAGLSLTIDPAGSLNTGNLKQTDPAAPDRQIVTGGLSASFARQVAMSGHRWRADPSADGRGGPHHSSAAGLGGRDRQADRGRA